MGILRSRNKLNLDRESYLVLESSRGRRVAYGVLFFVLVAALVFGMDPARDFAGGRIVWSVVYGVLLIGLLFMSGRANRVVFDRENGRFESYTSFVGRRVREGDSFPLTIAESLLVQKVVLIDVPDEGERRGGAVFGFMEPRSRLYRLFLVTSEGRVKLEEAADKQEIDGLADGISEFLSLPVEHEEL